jgi:hypothetical protein
MRSRKKKKKSLVSLLNPFHFLSGPSLPPHVRTISFAWLLDRVRDPGIG